MGTTKPQPCSQGTGLFGLKSHSSKWVFKQSSLTTDTQPCGLLSHVIYNLNEIYSKMLVKQKQGVAILKAFIKWEKDYTNVSILCR